MSLADVPTAGDLEDQLDRLTNAVEKMTTRLDELSARLDKRD